MRLLIAYLFMIIQIIAHLQEVSCDFKPSQRRTPGSVLFKLISRQGQKGKNATSLLSLA